MYKSLARKPCIDCLQYFRDVSLSHPRVSWHQHLQCRKTLVFPVWDLRPVAWCVAKRITRTRLECISYRERQKCHAGRFQSSCVRLESSYNHLERLAFYDGDLDLLSAHTHSCSNNMFKSGKSRVFKVISRGVMLGPGRGF